VKNIEYSDRPQMEI